MTPPVAAYTRALKYARNDRSEPAGESSDAVAPPFYSHAAAVIASRLPEAASSEQVRKTLLNAGVKPEEMRYGGIDAHLAANARVKKGDLAQVVADRTPALTETVYGGIPYRPDLDITENESRDGYSSHAVADRGSGRRYTVLDYGDGSPEVYDDRNRRLGVEHHTGVPAGAQHLGDAVEAITRHLNELYQDAAEGTNGPPKHSRYQLPGGENYRERVYSLPAHDPEGDRTAYLQSLATKYGVKLYEVSPATVSPAEAAEVRRLDRETRKRSRNFLSDHWDEPNVVFHVRHNDRVDAAGRRLLHLEEVQSDWHQIGRKRGYRGDPIDIDRRFVVFDARDRPIHSTDDENEAKAHAAAANGGYTESRLLRRSERDDIEVGGRGVPDAPFKKTWQELALRRMLRHAAEHGYDGVSWTPGDDHADRYPDAANPEKEAERREGLKEWYDERFPQYLDKYLKRFGVKTAKTKIAAGGREVEVPFVPVTPEMRREFVGRGQALFSRLASAYAALNRPLSHRPATTNTRTPA